MKYGSITSRRCKRCGAVGTAAPKANLCKVCTGWVAKHPAKVVKP